MAQHQAIQDYSGKWHCSYWYPSNVHVGKDVSKYDATIQQDGNNLVLESLPNDKEAYMFTRMVINGRLVTGTWHENTSPYGEFKGAIYSGVILLLIDESGNRMKGKWLGDGQENGKLQIYTGRWEIVRKD